LARAQGLVGGWQGHMGKWVVGKGTRVCGWLIGGVQVLQFVQNPPWY
jgi:hypothetical protein